MQIRTFPAAYRQATLDISGLAAVYCGGFDRGPWLHHEAPLSETSVSADLETLLGRCAEGDQRAFRAIYDQTAPRLYAVALRITREHALAADAVHDAFLQVWQRAGRFDLARGSAETWLISLTRYRALDLIRRTGREVLSDELPERADEDPDQLERLTARREGAALHRCLETLDLDKRKLVMMAFLDGLSHAELATRLEAPLGTIKSWIRRGLQDLRRCLEA